MHLKVTELIDDYKHKGLRRKLVEIIRNKGISDENVLKAIGSVPRHLFMDSSFLSFAYEDKPFPIGCEQTISQPFTVAFQTELLEVKTGDKVLEIGTGSGYQACVLMEMGARVYSIERHKELYLKAKSLISMLKYKPRLLIFGDGFKGMPVHAPFDKILVTAGSGEVPAELLRQLKPGGILVIPVGDTDTQVMKKIIKISEQESHIENHGYFRFVPLLKDKSGH